MLRSLSVNNFALIEHLNVEFSAGLNILTGETGAGKSILIDSLNTVLGGRASADYIREGCDYFRIEALFDITGLEQVRNISEQHGIVLEEDGTLIISRRYTKNGKNTIIINGCHVTLSVLKLIGQNLVDMHGQHENQALLRPETYLNLVDSFDAEIVVDVDEYRCNYRQWLDIRKQIDISEDKLRERIQRLDMLKWQTDEIAAAALRPGEETELENKIKLFTNTEKISRSVAKAYGLLEEGNNGSESILKLISDMKRELESAIRYDQRLEPPINMLTDIIYQLKEISRDLNGYIDTIEYDPKQLVKLNERMDIIYKLRKKYGTTIADILSYYEKALNEIACISSSDEHMAKMNDEQKKLHDDLLILAGKIDKKRRRSSRLLSEAVISHLQKLGMPSSRFEIEVRTDDKLNSSGCNEVAILFSANAGESLKPLHKVASGGELSRIALALKTVCAHQDSTSSIVFDEIDTGIGGQTVQMVGERIAMVALYKQVLCITHSPQIVCMADNHLHIEKIVQNNRTKTEIRHLNNDERKIELARMIAGREITKSAIENAKEMITTAQAKKEIWKKEAQA